MDPAQHGSAKTLLRGPPREQAGRGPHLRASLELEQAAYCPCRNKQLSTACALKVPGLEPVLWAAQLQGSQEAGAPVHCREDEGTWCRAATVGNGLLLAAGSVKDGAGCHRQ